MSTMIQFLLLVTLALVSGQHMSGSRYGRGYGDDSDRNSNGNNYGYDKYDKYNDEDNSYRHEMKCPTLRGARNNDFEDIDGLWYRIQENWSDRPPVCSINVYQLTSRKTHALIQRQPETSPMYKKSEGNDEITSGTDKKIDESSWVEDTDDEQNLVTVLASDYHKGYALVHSCDLKDPRQQTVQILSKNRHLDSKTIDRLRQALRKSGLEQLEAQLKDVPQDNCQQHKSY